MDNRSRRIENQASRLASALGRMPGRGRGFRPNVPVGMEGGTSIINPDLIRNQPNQVPMRPDAAQQYGIAPSIQTLNDAVRGFARGTPNMERMPRMLPDEMKAQPMPGDGTARIQPFPYPDQPGLVQPIRDLRRDMQQMPRERLSPGVYRGADGSLVNQQGQPLPNQPRRDQQQPLVQNLQPSPFARDQFQYYQPPPQDVYIGRGMSMPIPQRPVPMPPGMMQGYGDTPAYGAGMTPQQVQQMEQNLQGVAQGFQQGAQQFPWRYPLK